MDGPQDENFSFGRGHFEAGALGGFGGPGGPSDSTFCMVSKTKTVLVKIVISILNKTKI